MKLSLAMLCFLMSWASQAHAAAQTYSLVLPPKVAPYPPGMQTPAFPIRRTFEISEKISVLAALLSPHSVSHHVLADLHQRGMVDLDLPKKSPAKNPLQST